MEQPSATKESAERILLIEDEATLARLLSRKLERSGYQVIVAENGREGLEQIREHKPDLVLLDMLLPEVNGFTVLETMRDEDLLSRIPVIIISNSGQPVEIERALEMGAVDHMIKLNFDPVEVEQKVERVLAKKREGTLFGADGRPDGQASQKPPQKGVGEQEQKQKEAAAGGEEIPPAIEPNGESNGHTVLIVEDDAFLSNLLTRKLSEEGYTVHQVVDVEHARDVLKNKQINLICLDILLPGENGFVFLDELRKNKTLEKTPVLILSNLGQQEEIDRGLAAGAADYLIKANMSPGEIVEKVNALIKT